MILAAMPNVIVSTNVIAEFEREAEVSSAASETLKPLRARLKTVTWRRYWSGGGPI